MKRVGVEQQRPVTWAISETVLGMALGECQFEEKVIKPDSTFETESLIALPPTIIQK